MEDSEVVGSIVAGDPHGLDDAFDRHADPLYKYCRTLLRDPSDAADAVQDAFVIAAARLDRLREPDRRRKLTLTTVPDGASAQIDLSGGGGIPCGTSATSPPPTITVEPGGAVYSVCTSLL
jgi:hypothetical protein